jgi:hypothetical protein
MANTRQKISFEYILTLFEKVVNIKGAKTKILQG